MQNFGRNWSILRKYNLNWKISSGFLKLFLVYGISVIVKKHRTGELGF